MRPARRSLTRQTLIRLIGTLLAIALLIYLLSRQGWDEILLAIRRIPPGQFALALGLMVVSRLVVPARWYVLLRAAKVEIPFSQCLRLTLAGLFAANFLPTTIGGDIVRLAGALHYQGDRAVSAASIAVDRLVGLAGMATALPLGFQPFWAWLLATGASLPGSAQHAGIASLPFGRWWRSLWELGRKGIRRLIQALGIWWGQPRILLASFGFTWLHMLAKFLAIWILFASMGEELSIWRITGLWSFTYFLTLFPISINGLGVQEISMVFIFSNIGGAPMSIALPAALLTRFLEMGASLPGALFLPAVLSGMEGKSQI